MIGVSTGWSFSNASFRFEFGIWSGRARPLRLRVVVLLVERAALRLGVEVAGQVLAGDDRLEVVRQQQALRGARRGVVVHDAALEALVDEVVVLRDRLAGALVGSAPHLQVHAWQQSRLALAIRERLFERHGVREGRVELDGLAVRTYSGALALIQSWIALA